MCGPYIVKLAFYQTVCIIASTANWHSVCTAVRYGHDVSQKPEHSSLRDGNVCKRKSCLLCLIQNKSISLPKVKKKRKPLNTYRVDFFYFFCQQQQFLFIFLLDFQSTLSFQRCSCHSGTWTPVWSVVLKEEALVHLTISIFRRTPVS